MKRPPEPTSADIAAWKRLARFAATAAADPTAAMGDLAKAVKTARRAVVFGVVSRENICIRLVRLADRFVGETMRGRRELTAELQALAEEVSRRAGGAEDGHPPPRRHRADLDG